MYEEAPSAGPSSQDTRPPTSIEPRFRSAGLSMPWRQRRRSSVFNMEGSTLVQTRSHGFGEVFEDAEASNAPKPDQPRNVKGMLRRASLSLKSGVMGIVHRRTSVPAQHPSDLSGDELRHFRLQPAPGTNPRPTTAHATWRRVRQAASFHRQSRLLHTGYGDRGFELEPIESPTFPVPGSGEQPPIIPRNTGAAARQAAASAYNNIFAHGIVDSPAQSGLA